ncbi:5-methylcytosine-specific restriction enzyme A [Carnobacterium alterfunditum]|uniref:5-methylcytosine-specific restriction enzyme A n=1 Tax=Carnobacterium alterfunditum TaxID=28230 RepID=A0A1N6IIX3_9LACT|nr:HNH endonuclease signature motif containing protein [Carnobacterium alterfunditum]SIO31972.1 5-methylcytosine-specific restriction enzyme A [Carnobacterium alterfunditum]
MKLLSDILNSKNLQTLSFVFFNLSDETESGFNLKVLYKTSKFASIELDRKIVEENNKLLKEYTGLSFELTGESSHRATIDNDMSLDRNSILSLINSKIQQLRFVYTDSDFGRIIINSFFIPRGSIDLNRSYYSVDILNKNITEDYIDNLLSILMSLEDINQLNINFRELQPEFIEGIKRNTQLRINLKWFYNRYYKDFKKINLYKANILENKKENISLSTFSKKFSSGFIERALFYKERILGQEFLFKQLTKETLNKKIAELRKVLDFDQLGTDNSINSKESRNKAIVNLVTISQPDECFSCKNKYKIENRTFKIRDNSRYYLELHHVISFGADKSGDVLENLVKLCPSCHRALTPNRAEESYQKKIITDILNNSSESKKYVSNFVKDSSNIDHLVDFVYSNLK